MADGVRLRRVLIARVHTIQVELNGAEKPIQLLPLSDNELAAIAPRRERGFQSLRDGVRLFLNGGIMSAQTQQSQEQFYFVGPGSDQ